MSDSKAPTLNDLHTATGDTFEWMFNLDINL